MKTTLLATAIVFMTITQALAGPCGFEEKGRLVIKGYAIGATAVPAEQKARLTEFAKTAKHRFGICIFAQVDATGSEEANKKVAQACRRRSQISDVTRRAQRCDGDHETG